MRYITTGTLSKYGGSSFTAYKRKRKNAIAIADHMEEKVLDALNGKMYAFNEKQEREQEKLDTIIERKMNELEKERSALYKKFQETELAEMKRLIEVFSEENPEYLI